MVKNLTVTLFAILFLSACSTGYNVKNVPAQAEPSLAADFMQNVGDRIFFGYNKSDLNSDAKARLDKQAIWLKEHTSVKATIEGHCDERGTREFNLALGEKRAEAVKRYLTHHGIDSSRLDTISYGKEKPEVVGDTEDAWAQNRRAVTSIN